MIKVYTYLDILVILFSILDSSLETFASVVLKLHLLQLQILFSSLLQNPISGSMYPGHFVHFSADMKVPNSVGSCKLSRT